ncbi:hypothetical protein DFP72DRAFT_846950 [Ephemerocybe angulata]|uniref:Uncharacterized protein n=1 Tax=Ephemerocybe angulata TaxID=980116 RepID=A0A8H6I057_9AGAR|nr:hypothetical protein DFP72DRAFT_846950 [Tulosesus angulatus]
MFFSTFKTIATAFKLKLQCKDASRSKSEAKSNQVAFTSTKAKAKAPRTRNPLRRTFRKAKTSVCNRAPPQTPITYQDASTMSACMTWNPETSTFTSRSITSLRESNTPSINSEPRDNRRNPPLNKKNPIVSVNGQDSMRIFIAGLPATPSRRHIPSPPVTPNSDSDSDTDSANSETIEDDEEDDLWPVMLERLVSAPSMEIERILFGEEIRRRKLIAEARGRGRT